MVNIKEESKSYVMSILAKYFSSIEDNLSGKCAIDLIIGLQRKLEKELERVISKKSIYYWYHIFRREPPLRLQNEKLASVSLWRQIAEIAFVKYGKRSYINDMDVNITYREALNGKLVDMLPYDVKEKDSANSCSYVKSFNSEDIGDYYIAEYLVFEYWYTTTAIRRLYKGGILRVYPDLEFKYRVINENERLIMNYDTRNENYGGRATLNGVMFPNERNEIKKPGYYFSRNLQQIDEGHLPMFSYFSRTSGISKSYIPNFLPMQFDYAEFLSRNSFHEKPYYEKYGISLKNAIYTLKAISILATLRCHQDRMATRDLLKLSYFVTTSIEVYATEVANIMNTNEFPDDVRSINSNEVIKIIKLLSKVEGYEREKWLQNRFPSPLAIKIHRRGYLIDYYSIFRILADITHNYDKSGYQILKGEQLENDVKSELISIGIQPWKEKVIVNHKKQSEEIDCAFEYNGILFILECKSIERSRGFEQGDCRALKHREDKLDKALQQVDRKAKMIIDSNKSINHPIGSNTNRICSIVITPFCEYIWSDNSFYWLNEDLPRICTIYELVDLLKDTTKISSTALRDLG